MGREFKPGDVAMVRHSKSGREMLMLRGYKDKWFEPTGSFSDVHVKGVRPVIVIDPEALDLELIERALVRWANWTSLVDEERAIRVLLDAIFPAVTPPKPDEPTGVGAVVEDAEGNRFVRYIGSDFELPWRMVTTQSISAESWATISAVRVLSEGVASDG